MLSCLAAITFSSLDSSCVQRATIASDTGSTDSRGLNCLLGEHFVGTLVFLGQVFVDHKQYSLSRRGFSAEK